MTFLSPYLSTLSHLEDEMDYDSKVTDWALRLFTAVLLVVALLVWNWLGKQ